MFSRYRETVRSQNNENVNTMEIKSEKPLSSGVKGIIKHPTFDGETAWLNYR